MTWQRNPPARNGDWSDVASPSTLTVYERERAVVLYRPDGQPLTQTTRRVGFTPITKEGTR